MMEIFITIHVAVVVICVAGVWAAALFERWRGQS